MKTTLETQQCMNEATDSQKHTHTVQKQCLLFSPLLGWQQQQKPFDKISN